MCAKWIQIMNLGNRQAYAKRAFRDLALLLTWIKVNPRMDRYLHPLKSVGWITYPFATFNGEAVTDCIRGSNWLVASQISHHHHMPMASTDFLTRTKQHRVNYVHRSLGVLYYVAIIYGNVSWKRNYHHILHIQWLLTRNGWARDT